MPDKKQVVLEYVTRFAGTPPEVPFNEGVNVDELTAADQAAGIAPMFVTLPLAAFDQRSRNERRYSREEVLRMYEAIRGGQITGNMGHLNGAERASAYKAAALKWVGALVDQNGVLWGKAYVTHSAEGRELAEEWRVAKASNGHAGTSLYGLAYETWNEELEVYEVSDLDLEQIDAVNPHRVGVLLAGSARPHITSESIADADDESEPNETGLQEAQALANRLKQTLDDLASEGLPREVILSWIADTAGIDAETVHQFFNENMELPRGEQLEAVARVLDVSADELARLAGHSNNTLSELEGTMPEINEQERIAQLEEKHRETVRELNNKISELERKLRNYDTVAEMVRDASDAPSGDVALDLQAVIAVRDHLRVENAELLEATIAAEVSRIVKVEAVQPAFIERVRNEQPATRAQVQAAVNKVAKIPSMQQLLELGVRQEMGPAVTTPAAPTTDHNDDDWFIIPNLNGGA